MCPTWLVHNWYCLGDPAQKELLMLCVDVSLGGENYK